MMMQPADYGITRPAARRALFAVSNLFRVHSYSLCLYISLQTAGL
jgi:hypothetical protein